jgi:hypothetical protein
MIGHIATENARRKIRWIKSVMIHFRHFSYPPQQLPGVPQELGDPQQPPLAGPANDPDEPLILWADINFLRVLP